jgi:hypothetical protein
LDFEPVLGYVEPICSIIFSAPMKNETDPEPAAMARENEKVKLI